MQNYRQQLKDQIKTDKIRCFDCGTPFPQWVSTSYGIFVCLECAGVHRTYGAATSRVRSINMDDWPEREYLFLKEGGNLKLSNYIKKYNLNKNEKEFYKNPKMIEYSISLLEKVDGKKIEKPVERSAERPKTTISTPIINNVYYNKQPKQSDSSLNEILATTIEYVGKTVKVGAKIIKEKTLQCTDLINRNVIKPSISMIKEKKQSKSTPQVIQDRKPKPNNKVEEGWNKWD